MANIGTSHGTTIPSGKDIQRKWFVIDATGKTLGRLATVAASVLAGKLNPLYTPYIDMGDHIIVVNAEKIVLTGMKSDQKLYRRYTGFPGGLREESFLKLLARRPEMIVEQAVKGMLPKSKLGRQMATKLKVYKGDKHPHFAQQPQPLDFHASNAAKVPGAPKSGQPTFNHPGKAPDQPIRHHMEGQTGSTGV